jgi:ribonuclease R
MSQAVYGPEEKGHFGLAYDHYAHFTSPIRRYPDLLVHRAIKSIIYSEKVCDDVQRPDDLDLSKYTYAYDLPKMLVLGEHCSMTERRADEATRDVNSWLKCEYLQQHLGEVFEGIISGVTGFGFFVELADLYVEGLVHVSSLSSDYYQYDAAKHRMVGERTGTSYSLGDSVVVEVAKINLEERKVDLLLVSAEPKKRSRRRSVAKNNSAVKGTNVAKGNNETKGKKPKKTGVKASDKTVKKPTKRKPKVSKSKAEKSKSEKSVVKKKAVTKKAKKAPETEKTSGVHKRKVKTS